MCVEGTNQWIDSKINFFNISSDCSFSKINTFQRLNFRLTTVYFNSETLFITLLFHPPPRVKKRLGVS
jgi:hypothetical protein